MSQLHDQPVNIFMLLRVLKEDLVRSMSFADPRSFIQVYRRDAAKFEPASARSVQGMGSSLDSIETLKGTEGI